MSYLKRFEHNHSRGARTASKGQVLAHFSEHSGMQRAHSNFKSGNFYLVTSVSVATAIRKQHSRASLDSRVHTFGLRKLAWSDSTSKWAFAGSEFSMRFNSEDLYEYFGLMQDTHVAVRKDGFVYNWLKHVMTEVNMDWRELLDTVPEGKRAPVDYDKIIESIGMKILRRSGVPQEESIDIIHDTVMTTFDKRTMSRFDPSRLPDPSKGLIAFLGPIFNKRILSAIKKWKREHSKDYIVREEDDVKGSPVDRLITPGPFERPERAMLWKDLVRDLSKFLDKQTRSDVFTKMLGLILQDTKGKDIAKMLGMSPGNISHMKKRLYSLLEDYAKFSHNTLLLDLLEAKGVTSQTAMDVFDELKRVFDEYQEQSTATATEMTPVGQVRKVRKYNLQDPTDGDLLTEMALDSSKSSTELRESLLEEEETLRMMDDLVDGEDGLVGLRIDSSEIRDT